MRSRYAVAVAVSLLGAGLTRADFTNNIMLTGYWPPTNEMLRRFSSNPEQNPDGWIGGNWEGRGYDIYSFFPEFPEGLGRGVGDFEVDYQDTSYDFWRFVEQLDPVAIVTFGRGSPGRSWELEWQTRNLAQWIDDYSEPLQPTPAPPDPSVPADFIRYSTLPMQAIVDAVNAAYADIRLNAFIDDTNFAGAFLCEYIGYHASWYHDLHALPEDPYWNVAAGHIHVGSSVGIRASRIATEITLRELTSYLDTIVPEPGTAALLAIGGMAIVRSRRVCSPPKGRPAETMSGKR